MDGKQCNILNENEIQETPRIVCRYFLSESGCNKGIQCPVSHVVSKNMKPDEICRYFVAGHCSFQKKCWYNHSYPIEDCTKTEEFIQTYTNEVKGDEAHEETPTVSQENLTVKVTDTKTICRFFITGNCAFKDNCLFEHIKCSTKPDFTNFVDKPLDSTQDNYEDSISASDTILDTSPPEPMQKSFIIPVQENLGNVFNKYSENYMLSKKKGKFLKSMPRVYRSMKKKEKLQEELNNKYILDTHSLCIQKKQELEPRKYDMLCRFFVSPQGCRDGDECQFSHIITPKSKVDTVCRYFIKGCCAYNGSCYLEHA